MRPRALRAVALAAATTAIVLGVPAHADLAHAPVVNCEPPVDASPALAFFAGEAHVPAGHAASVVSLTVRCSYFDDNGGLAHSAEATANGPVVTVADYGGFYWHGFETMCQSAEVVYSDRHSASTPTVCTGLAYSVNPGPPPESAPTVRCDHTRAPLVTNAWVVETTAVAGVRADVPLTTDVSCTLRDTAGRAVTASATAVGGVAVASFADRLSVASLASKCYRMTVHYFASGTTSAETCESF